jgi:hypothetical protein
LITKVSYLCNKKFLGTNKLIQLATTVTWYAYCHIKENNVTGELKKMFRRNGNYQSSSKAFQIPDAVNHTMNTQCVRNTDPTLWK